MMKISLTLALLAGFALANETTQTANYTQQAEARVKRTNDIKIEMAQMKIQEKTTHMQSHDTMQMSQYQNMTQHHAAQEFEKEFMDNTYSQNGTTSSNWTKKR